MDVWWRDPRSDPPVDHQRDLRSVLQLIIGVIPDWSLRVVMVDRVMFVNLWKKAHRRRQNCVLGHHKNELSLLVDHRHAHPFIIQRTSPGGVNGTGLLVFSSPPDDSPVQNSLLQVTRNLGTIHRQYSNALNKSMGYSTRH